MNNEADKNDAVYKSKGGRFLSVLCILLCAVMTLSSCNFVQRTGYESAAETEVQTGEYEENTVPMPTAADKIYEAQTPVINYGTGGSSTLSDDIKSKADGISKKYGAVGVQAAVLHNGTVINTYQYGLAVREQNKPVTSDTKFRIASLSKIVTDAVFMALAEEGRVSENMDISDVFGASIRNPNFPDVKITPAMLMTHSSSIIDGERFLSGRNGNSSITIEDILSSGSTYSSHRPGSYFEYSNFGIALIGSICERATGQSFETLASKYIFNPLQIDAAYTASHLRDRSQLAALYGSGGYSIEKQLSFSFSNTIGATYDLVQGNLTISAKDYAKIIGSITQSAISGRKGIISSSSAGKMLSSQFSGQGYSLGYGQYIRSRVIEGQQLCTHNGTNFGMFSTFAVNPRTGDGVVVFTSGASGQVDSSADVYSVCLELIRLLWP